MRLDILTRSDMLALSKIPEAVESIVTETRACERMFRAGVLGNPRPVSPTSSNPRRDPPPRYCAARITLEGRGVIETLRFLYAEGALAGTRFAEDCATA